MTPAQIAATLALHEWEQVTIEQNWCGLYRHSGHLVYVVWMGGDKCWGEQVHFGDNMPLALEPQYLVPLPEATLVRLFNALMAREML